MNSKSRRFDDCTQIGERRSLPVGAGDMNDGSEARLRIPKPLQDSPHAIELEIDDLGMKRKQALQDGIARRHSEGFSVRRDRDQRGAAILGAIRSVEIGRRLHEQPSDSADRLAHVMAVHDHIDHAVLLQIFGALETFR
jgi:hypothetical protein